MDDDEDEDTRLLKDGRDITVEGKKKMKIWKYVQIQRMHRGRKEGREEGKEKGI